MQSNNLCIYLVIKILNIVVLRLNNQGILPYDANIKKKEGDGKNNR